MKVKVCCGNACKQNYSEYILKRLKADIEFHKLEGVILEETPCMGQCKDGPNVAFDKTLKNHMNPVKASKMMLDKKRGIKPKKKRKNNK